jgi:hypothetical protein
MAIDSLIAPLHIMGLMTDTSPSQYERREIGEGITVYEFTGFPKHYACPQCFEQGNIHTLRFLRIDDGYFECPACKFSFSAALVHKGHTLLI